MGELVFAKHFLVTINNKEIRDDVFYSMIDYEMTSIYNNIMKRFSILRVLIGVICGVSVLVIIVFFAFNIFLKEDNSEDLLCKRNSRQSNLPEFDRALDLINERVYDITDSTENDGSYNIINCITVKYKDLSDIEADGVFYMDEKISTYGEEYVIFVDDKYKEEDILLTSLLLRHEISHAFQFARRPGEIALNIPELSCLAKEVEAHRDMYELMGYFNLGERESIQARLEKYSNDPRFGTVRELGKVRSKVEEKCSKEDSGNYQICSGTSVLEYLTELIEESPSYKKQCNL